MGASPTTNVFDLDVFLERTGNDLELARELAALFNRGLPDLLRAVDMAIGSRDPLALERSAHALKGAVANFSLGPAYLAAEQLEMTGRHSLPIDAQAAAGLKNELMRLQDAIAASRLGA